MTFRRMKKAETRSRMQLLSQTGFAGLSENAYSEVFYSSSQAMAITDPAWGLLEVNRAFLQLLGYSEDELKQLKLTALIHAENKSELSEILTALEHKKIYSTQIEVPLV